MMLEKYFLICAQLQTLGTEFISSSMIWSIKFWRNISYLKWQESPERKHQVPPTKCNAPNSFQSQIIQLLKKWIFHD